MVNLCSSCIRLSDNHYGYYCNSNMTTRTIGTTYTLSYDAENRPSGYAFRTCMTAASGGGLSASFVYDGDGDRVKGSVAGVTTVYIGNHFEWSGSTSTMKKYYYAGGVRVVQLVRGQGRRLKQWMPGEWL